MPHFSTICNGGYDFWVCRYTSSSLTTWKFTEVRIQTHARNFIWLLCFSNCKSLDWIIYVFSFILAENTSLPNVGSNGSHSDPFCAEQINASALLYRGLFCFLFLFYAHQGSKSANNEKDVCLKTLGMLVQQNH